MYVSIFNDVIGPVMRGPSSSHCAAALRIGRLARDLMEGDLKKVSRVRQRGSPGYNSRESGIGHGIVRRSYGLGCYR